MTHHRWTAPVTVLPAESPDGNERTERICSVCGLVKITVHPPYGHPWREWRTSEGMAATLDATPPCLPMLMAKEAAHG